MRSALYTSTLALAGVAVARVIIASPKNPLLWLVALLALPLASLMQVPAGLDRLPQL
jgi:hypothetical protein